MSGGRPRRTRRSNGSRRVWTRYASGLGPYVAKHMRDRHDDPLAPIRQPRARRRPGRRARCLRAAEDPARQLGRAVPLRREDQEGAELHLARHGCPQQRRALHGEHGCARGAAPPRCHARASRCRRCRPPGGCHRECFMRNSGRPTAARQSWNVEPRRWRSLRRRPRSARGGRSASRTRMCSKPGSPMPSSPPNLALVDQGRGRRGIHGPGSVLPHHLRDGGPAPRVDLDHRAPLRRGRRAGHRAPDQLRRRQDPYHAGALSPGRCG